jgi:hypothetical protein
MANIDPTEPLIEPRLKSLLAHLRNTPPRDDRTAARNRAKFLAELDSLSEEKAGSLFVRLVGWFNQIRRNWRET